MTSDEFSKLSIREQALVPRYNDGSPRLDSPDPLSQTAKSELQEREEEIARQTAELAARRTMQNGLVVSWKALLEKRRRLQDRFHWTRGELQAARTNIAKVEAAYWAEAGKGSYAPSVIEFAQLITSQKAAWPMAEELLAKIQAEEQAVIAEIRAFISEHNVPKEAWPGLPKLD